MKKKNNGGNQLFFTLVGERGQCVKKRQKSPKLRVLLFREL